VSARTAGPRNAVPTATSFSHSGRRPWVVRDPGPGQARRAVRPETRVLGAGRSCGHRHPAERGHRPGSSRWFQISATPRSKRKMLLTPEKEIGRPVGAIAPHGPCPCRRGPASDTTRRRQDQVDMPIQVWDPRRKSSAILVWPAARVPQRRLARSWRT
jgi:hypothetical protein